MIDATDLYSSDLISLVSSGAYFCSGSILFFRIDFGTSFLEGSGYDTSYFYVYVSVSLITMVSVTSTFVLTIVSAFFPEFVLSNSFGGLIRISFS